ncbi:hypothetical protein [Geoalkalibacter subterraneus]|uniref:hypothetical protein n=1 Tax=Geoalkalibacter subterraneus TaxID=483547 RepID=UPI00130DDA41|nr:hypothetical protein [Geoalkalibacter subterraneus]
MSIKEDIGFCWQTKTRDTLEQEYQIYREQADNGQGLDIATGEPLLSFDEWLAR